MSKCLKCIEDIENVIQRTEKKRAQAEQYIFTNKELQ